MKLTQKELEAECKRMQKRIAELELFEEENMRLQGFLDLANFTISKFQNEMESLGAVSLFMDEFPARTNAQEWLEQIANDYHHCDKRISYLDELASDDKVLMLTIDDYGDVPVAMAILNRNDSNKTTLRKIKLPIKIKHAHNETNQDYAYETIKEFEDIVGHSVNEAFKIGWDMARITNSMLGIKSKSNLQERVGKWATKAFPHSDDRAKIEHIRDEIAELKSAPDDPFEVADIYLILLHLAYAKDFDLMKNAGKTSCAKTVSGAIENIESALGFFENRATEIDGVGGLIAISENLFQIASIQNFSLFEIAEKKFALVQERVYGEPDERGVSHHTVKAQGEL